VLVVWVLILLVCYYWVYSSFCRCKHLIFILGESYLICNENERRMGEEIATQTLPPIKSCLGVGDFSGCLKRALLEVVAGCVVCTTEEAFEYIKCTLLYISNGENCKHLS